MRCSDLGLLSTIPPPEEQQEEEITAGDIKPALAGEVCAHA